MVAVKPAGINRFLSQPESLDAYLIYGPDEGLVSERAATLSKSLAAKTHSETEQVRLLNEDLEANPDRLALDLKTISMFGERKIIRAINGKNFPLAAFEELLKTPPFEADLIIEAGDLKKTAKLRKLFENAANLAAIPCYKDTAASLSELIDEVLKDHDLTINQANKSLLTTRLGADRALSRKELEKLALYARSTLGGENEQNDTAVTQSMIDAILGDMSEITLDAIIKDTLLGNPHAAQNQLKRTLAQGIAPTPVFLILLRQLQQLYKGALSVAAGQTIHAVAKSQRPPLYFERRDNFVKQLNLWQEDSLARAIMKTQDTMTTARKRNNPALEKTDLEALILSLAKFAHQKQNQSRART